MVEPNGTLTFKVPHEDDEGVYQCFAKNKHGFASFKPHEVRKSFLDGFKDSSFHVIEAQLGQPLKFECEAPNGYPKPSVYWMIQVQGSGEIETIDDERKMFDQDGNLWFTSVTDDDALKNAHYACAAASSFRNEYKLGKRVLLKVIHADDAVASEDDNDEENEAMKDEMKSEKSAGPIMQYVTEPHVVALRGQRTELFCIYGGSPTVHVTWKINGTAINYDKRVKEKNFGKSLLIRDTRLLDKGAYSCDVSNGMDDGNQSSLITVDVLAEPYFISHPKSVVAVENETATVEFTCEVRGEPGPEIIFTHNGKILNISSSSSSSSPSSSSESSSASTTTTVASTSTTISSSLVTGERLSVLKNKLTIKNLIKSDIGNYACNATNKLGYAYRDFYLDIVKPQSKS